MKTRVMRLYIPGYHLFVVSVNRFVKDDCVTLSFSFVFLLCIISFTTLSLQLAMPVLTSHRLNLLPAFVLIAFYL
ncbi:MAG: hypothetical protein PVI00_10390 [Desulfobacterales bacterium]